VTLFLVAPYTPITTLFPYTTLFRSASEIVLSSSLYLREIEGLAVPHGIHCHIAGIDLVRNEKGEFFVLEDNLRTPSGASYVQANRYVMKRILPDLFAGYPVRPVEGYVH